MGNIWDKWAHNGPFELSAGHREVVVSIFLEGSAELGTPRTRKKRTIFLEGSAELGTPRTCKIHKKNPLKNLLKIHQKIVKSFIFFITTTTKKYKIFTLF